MKKFRIAAAGIVATLTAGTTALMVMPHAQAAPETLSSLDKPFVDARGLTDLDRHGVSTPSAFGAGPESRDLTCSQRFSNYRSDRAAAQRNRGAANFVHSRYDVPMSDHVLAYSYGLAAAEQESARFLLESMQMDKCSQVPPVKGESHTVMIGIIPSRVTCPKLQHVYEASQQKAKHTANALRTFRDTYHVPMRSKVDINYAAHVGFVAKGVEQAHHAFTTFPCP